MTFLQGGISTMSLLMWKQTSSLANREMWILTFFLYHMEDFRKTFLLILS